eukprot:1079646-Rhodomonas_salina.1
MTVQVTLLYGNPLPPSEMPYECIDSADPQFWNSTAVLQPIDVAGAASSFLAMRCVSYDG